MEVGRLKYFLFFIFLFISISGISQTRQELEERKRRTRDDIKKTNRILNELKQDRNVSLSRIRLLNKQIDNRTRLIHELDAEHAELGTRINDNEYVLGSLKSDLGNIREEYARLLIAVYNQRQPYFELVFLFSSNSFNQAYKRTLYLRQYSDYRNKQVHLILQIQSLLDKKNSELTELRMEKENILDELLTENEKLHRDKGTQSYYIGQLGKKEKSLRQSLKNKEAIAKKLDKEIDRILAEEAKKSTGMYKLTPEDLLISDRFEENKGKIPWPTRTGVVTSAFGSHPHPVLKNISVTNDGIDISTVKGSLVRNVFDGLVMKVVAIPGANQTVIVRHGDYLSVYRNLVDVMVRAGDRVKTLQEIGKVYTDTDKEESTLLHFRVYKERVKQNPEQWLSK